MTFCAVGCLHKRGRKSNIMPHYVI